jgi:hypothetical protein
MKMTSFLNPLELSTYNTHGQKLRFPPSKKSAIFDRVRYSKIG